MQGTQNTHISGANALDLGSVNQSGENISPDIKTNYSEIQENIKIEDPVIEDFLKEDQNNQSVENNIVESKPSSFEEGSDQFEEKENFQTPQLFTNDEEVYEKEQDSQPINVDTDLSDLEFDDKDDLEIPAFLRRQTN